MVSITVIEGSRKTTMPDSKKPIKGGGSAILDRLKGSIICGNKFGPITVEPEEQDVEEDLIKVGTPLSSFDSDDQSNTISVSKDDDMTNQPNVSNICSPSTPEDPTKMGTALKKSRLLSLSKSDDSPVGSIFTSTSGSSTRSSRSIGSRGIFRNVFRKPPLPSAGGSENHNAGSSSSGSPVLSSPGSHTPVTRYHSPTNSSGSIDLSSMVDDTMITGHGHSSVSGSITTSPASITRSSSSGSTTPSSASSTSGVLVTTKMKSMEAPRTSVEVLPHGNIFREGIPKGSLTRKAPRKDVMGMGTGRYGHGNIMSSGRKGVLPGGIGASDPGTWMEAGYAMYVKGNLREALRFYNRGIQMAPNNAEFRCNRAEVYMAMQLELDAVSDCEEAILLDKYCIRGHHLLGKLVIRLGQVEAARRHLSFQGVIPSETELKTLEAVEMYINNCSNARKNGDWEKALEQAVAAIDAGANTSPQLFACLAECNLKLLQLTEADYAITLVPEDIQTPNCCSDGTFFGMLSDAYPLFVTSQVCLARGRFGDAAVLAQKANAMDPKNPELRALVNKVQGVSRARNRGNELVNSNKLMEACEVYDEGLAFEPFNTTLRCSRALCSFKLKKWEQCIDDCTIALLSDPKDIRALEWRAFSYVQLETWAQAVQDYKVLIQKSPFNQEYLEGLSHAQEALKRAREAVQEIHNIEQFRLILSSPGLFIALFFETSEDPASRISSSAMDVLNRRYPEITFLKVDVKKSSDVSKAQNVKFTPMVKLYKDGRSVKEIPNPTLESLDNMVRNFGTHQTCIMMPR